MIGMHHRTPDGQSTEPGAQLTLAANGADLLLTPTPDWREEALCAQTDPEEFFVEKGGSNRSAKRICNACEVRPQCLSHALDNDERYGVWGGLSERERSRLKRSRA